jgi:phosphatidate cytidylyltransferase
MLNKNLLLRTLTGSLFVAVVVLSIFVSFWVFGFLFLGFAMIGVYELINASSQIRQLSINKWMAYLSAVLVYLLMAVSARQNSGQWLYLLLLLLPVSMLAELYRKKEYPFLNVAYTLLPSLYIALPLGLLNFLLPLGEGKLLLAFFVTIWAGDTFAYLVGSLIGKHRLFERISPKKSWEGTLGSMLLTLGLSFFYPIFFGTLGLWQWVVFVAIALVAGAFGDLVESLFKRSVSIKDSGSILPGHGGILDRFDAVILASPFIFVFLQIISTKF